MSDSIRNRNDVEEFIKGKSDRDVAVTSLILIDEHLLECSQRWLRVYRILIAVAGGIGMLVASKIVEMFQILPVHHG